MVVSVAVDVHSASSGDEGDEDAVGAGRGTTRLVLINRLPRPAQQASAAYVDVHTNDGEVQQECLLTSPYVMSRSGVILWPVVLARCVRLSTQMEGQGIRTHLGLERELWQ